MSVKGWTRAKVKDICDLGRGRVISSQEIESHPGIYPVFSSQSQNNGEMGRIDTYDFDGEYVTWTTDGAYAGTVFYRAGEFNCTNVCGILKAKSSQISIKFLAYQLSTLAKNYVSYVGNPKLMNNVMANIELSLPEIIEEQKQIAAVLSTVDRTIAQTEAIIAKQQRIKTGLMQDLLTKGIDENGNIRSEETHEFKDSAIGRIPVEWEVKKIEELLSNTLPSMRSGPFGSALLKEELVESGVPLLGIDNVHRERFASQYNRFVTPKKAEQLSRYYVCPNDLMITIMGTVGRCCVVPENIGLALSSKHVYTLSLDSNQYSSNLACLQINYAPWVLANFSRDEQGGIMSAIRSETLRSTCFPVPPREEIDEIDSIFAQIQNLITQEKRNLEKKIALKTGLMQDLLTGKVRVTELLKAPEGINL